MRGTLFLRLCAPTFREFLQDLPPQPRDEQLHDLLVCRIQPAGFGRRGGDAVVLQARTSRLADLRPLVPSLLSAIEATPSGTAKFIGQP